MIDEAVSESHQWRDLISITKEQWLTILEDKNVVTEKDVQLFDLLYTCDGCEATASFLARLLNMPHHAPLNSQVGQLGKRIVERLDISAPRRRYEEGFNWWHVPFLGESRKKGFYWILRPELQEAMREIDAISSLLETKIPEEIDYDGHEAFYEVQKNKYMLMLTNEAEMLETSVSNSMVWHVSFVVLILKRCMVALGKMLFMYIISSLSLQLVKHIELTL